MAKNIPVLVNEPADGARADEADVLIQAEAVRRSLNNLGYGSFTVSFTEDPVDLKRRLNGTEVTVVFNLVEAVRGENALQYLAPLALERLGIPFTGNPSEALHRTTNKVLAKEIMNLVGIPTPSYLSRDNVLNPSKTSRPGKKTPLIFKPVEEDASVGIREDLIGPYTAKEALDILILLEDETGMSYMAEEYIDGREFNVSIIEAAGVPAALPMVEQDFALLPPSSPRIVGYRAKWAVNSMEYTSIPRNYAFQSTDRALLEEARRLTMDCWSLFGLSGYARVDLRVNEQGRVFVLEVNANPCLSPDAGFVFAAGLAGLTMDDVVKLILDTALCRADLKMTRSAG